MLIYQVLKSNLKLLLIAYFFAFNAAAYGVLAGGRPNTVSGGQNAFAGVVNPANAVWVKDRIDIGVFWLHQESSLKNHDSNPIFLKGKTDLTYRVKNIFTPDIAVHKQFKLKVCSRDYEGSFSLATYTTPSVVKVQTKRPIPVAGSTPIKVYDKIQAISAIFSLKLSTNHSIGFAVDYLYFSHLRNGFQNSDNPLRSVSPGNVTNRGTDHSSGIGFSLGWRWNITKSLEFGAAWVKKSYCGQYRKYRGYEPHHAKNYFPQTLGAGFTYKLNQKLAGRVEVLWSNLGNLPNANNNVLSDGSLNRNKRGSRKSPGPGLQDAIYINLGLGYNLNPMLSFGAGYSHRIRFKKSSNFLSHSYTRQVIYDILSIGANIRYQKHDVFLTGSYSFKNRVSGYMPKEVGGGKFSSEKQNVSLSVSWGYLY
jgi:long-chain fatty acid transport protein